MTWVASLILGSVNAPYGTSLSACDLADIISEIDAARLAMGPAFSFFSEISPGLQVSFVEEMGLPKSKVQEVARYLQSLCPFPLALAA